MNETTELTIDDQIKQYEYLVDITLSKMFHNPETFAISKQITYDDLQSFGRIGIWRAITSYNKEKHGHLSYRSFIIRNIKWNINRYLYYEGKGNAIYKSRDAVEGNTVKMISMSHSPHKEENERTFYDIVSHDSIFNHASVFPNPEYTVVSKDSAERIFDKLSEKEKRIIKMRLKEGLTFQEIADKLGCSKQNIGMIFKKMYTYKDYFHKIAEVTP